VRNASNLARRRLDERLKDFAGLGAAPPMGWVRALRDALGLTGELARRIGIRPASLSDLEKNEAAGRRRHEARGRSALLALVRTSPDCR
jgi:hypothetical protein